ncbi:MAG: type 4a pilus biogenesis protein PilO [Ignavibacteriae bacterium]|nr:type 4a pilus biogenesis protein PilO [Ignavibacteriota bacterium]
MKIRNKKWKNINISIIGFTVFVIVIEFMPRFLNLGSQTFNVISDKIKLKETSSIDNNIKEQSLINKNLVSQLKQIVSNYEDDKNISTVMQYLNNIANKSNIKISSIKALKLKQEDKLWLQPVEIEITSNYEQLYNFTRFLEYSSKVILVNKLTSIPKTATKETLNTKLLLDVYLNL